MRFDMILALLHLGYRWLNRDKIGQLFIYAPLEGYVHQELAPIGT